MSVGKKSHDDRTRNVYGDFTEAPRQSVAFTGFLIRRVLGEVVRQSCVAQSESLLALHNSAAAQSAVVRKDL